MYFHRRPLPWWRRLTHICLLSSEFSRRIWGSNPDHCLMIAGAKFPDFPWWRLPVFTSAWGNFQSKPASKSSGLEQRHCHISQRAVGGCRATAPWASRGFHGSGQMGLFGCLSLSLVGELGLNDPMEIGDSSEQEVVACSPV